MLYDPKWETKTKPDVFSLEGLIAWLETQNPSTRYSYGDIHRCLLSQYFRSSGYRWAYCGPTMVSYSIFFLPPLFWKSIPTEMDNVSVGHPYTFGAALERARKVVA